MERKNKKLKTAGNGEGSLYYSESLQIWIFQYWFGNKRKTIKQRKNETVKHFKERVTQIKASINSGTYIETKKDTVISILEKHILQKFDDGITQENSYLRDTETLSQIKDCCSNFVNKPIQKVTLDDIQLAKNNIKKYSKSVIDKIWRLLKKAFSIASSPSVGLIPFNIMIDENLKKPSPEKRTKKVKPLTKVEREKLNYILDHQERNHKYRNIVKLEWITGMRIGEVLARSRDDINNDFSTLHIHNTLTKDKYGNPLIGSHTKTFNKETGIDEGERYFPISSNDLKGILTEVQNTKITNIHNLLFWNYDKNNFITASQTNSWLRRLNEKYKISKDNLHNHRLRHDRITQWKESGMDMKAIQYLAGHVEGSSVTEDYIDVSQEYAFKELSKII